MIRTEVYLSKAVYWIIAERNLSELYMGEDARDSAVVAEVETLWKP